MAAAAFLGRLGGFPACSARCFSPPWTFRTCRPEAPCQTGQPVASHPYHSRPVCLVASLVLRCPSLRPRPSHAAPLLDGCFQGPRTMRLCCLACPIFLVLTLRPALRSCLSTKVASACASFACCRPPAVPARSCLRKPNSPRRGLRRPRGRRSCSPGADPLPSVPPFAGGFPAASR